MALDLLKAYASNPFRVLDANTTDTRTTLIDRKADLILLGSEDELENALASLLNPQLRLEAELKWFPMTDAREIAQLFRRLVKVEEGELPTLATDSFLAQFNALRLVLVRLGVQSSAELVAYLHALACAADPLLPEQVFEEINNDRAIAGFPLLADTIALEAGLNELFHETVRMLVGGTEGIFERRPPQLIAQEMTSDYKNTYSPHRNSYFLEIAAGELVSLQ